LGSQSLLPIVVFFHFHLYFHHCFYCAFLVKIRFENFKWCRTYPQDIVIIGTQNWPRFWNGILDSYPHESSKFRNLIKRNISSPIVFVSCLSKQICKNIPWTTTSFFSNYKIMVSSLYNLSLWKHGTFELSKNALVEFV